MSFADWSPSHLILVAFAVVAFIGNVAIMFYRIGQNDKKIDKYSETLFHAFERLEDRMDKRFVEVIGSMNQRFDETNKRIDDTNQRLSDMQAETNQRLSDMQAETNHRFTEMQAETNHRFTEMNQRLSDMQAETNHRFTEMNQRLSDIEASLRQLNQNHINHLTHHGQNPPRANDS